MVDLNRSQPRRCSLHMKLRKLSGRSYTLSASGKSSETAPSSSPVNLNHRFKNDSAPLDASMNRPASPAAMTAGLENNAQPNGAIEEQYDAGMRHVDHCEKNAPCLQHHDIDRSQMPTGFQNGDTTSGSAFCPSSEQRHHMLPLSSGRVEPHFSTRTSPSQPTSAPILSSC